MTPVEQIKERLSILDIVGAYVELHKAGKQYKGRSPFTNEKTPSFFVSPDRGMYYCFSSQKGGDMFTFIEEMEGVDFKGALKILADKAGVELVPEDPQKRNARDAEYALLEEATQFFFTKREESKTVTAYVNDRGVTGKTMHAWRIGYAPDEWRTLRTHLKEKGFTDEQALKAGLIKSAEGGKEPYDIFRDRVMFPLADSSGRIIAFSGRTLKKDSDVPKYVNSPETELFQKSEILYGYDKAKNWIRSFDFTLVVEGQFDVVLAHQAGYTNTVAVSGTAFTPHHLSLLERLSSRIVLALDSDRAGISAVKRSAELMLARGLDVKVARMPEGKDPADIIKEDPKAFKKFIGSSIHVIEFLLDVLRLSAKDERSYKLETREEVIPLLARMPNFIDREHFEGIIAERLGTTKDAIHSEVERILMKNESAPPHKETKQEPSPNKLGSQTRKEDLVVFLTAFIEVEKGSEVSKEVDGHIRKIFSSEYLTELLSRNKESLSKFTFTIEATFDNLSEKQKREELSDKLTELSHLVARETLAGLRKEMISAEQEKNEEKLQKYLEETKHMELLLQTRIKLV